MGIAGLGAFAGGLNEGLVRGQNRLDTLAERDRVAARQKRVDDRQDEQWAREDEDRRSIETANAAGAEVMKKYQQEWQRQQPGPTLDGSPVPVNPFKPTPAMMLEAGRARTDKLLELKGPNELWAKSWANDEAMRTQVRAQAGQRVKAALVGGQDPTEAVTEFFGTINDGYSVTAVKRMPTVDGQAMLQVQRVNRYTGEPADPLMIPAAQLARDIDMLSANPVDAAKHNMAINLEAFKQAGTLKEIEARGNKDVTVAKEKHGLTLEEIGARNEGAKAVAKIRAGGSRNSAQAEEIRALAQERTSIDNDIRTLVQQLKDARPTDRPGIQSELVSARSRAADVRARLAALSTTGGSAESAVAPSAGQQLIDAATRDAKAQGLSEFTVNSKLVNEGAPTTIRLGSGATQAAGAPTAQPPGPDKFQAGKVYKDKNGARAKYLGNGQWQPLQ